MEGLKNSPTLILLLSKVQDFRCKMTVSSLTIAFCSCTL